MQKIILYTVMLFFACISGAKAQNDSIKKVYFEDKAAQIADNIEKITKEEKDALKLEVEAINKQLDEGEISREEADKQKMSASEKRASNIEKRVSVEEEKLSQLVKDKVDGKIAFDENNGGTIIVIGSNRNDSIGNKTEIILGSMKVYENGVEKSRRLSKRTTSQFVFSMGLNNVITDGEDFEDSDFSFWGSHSYEWGITGNTRIFKNNNLLHAKYGLSMMYNNLRPTDNRYFVKKDDVTELQDGFTNFKESRLRNVYLTVPLHLEFDFTPKKFDKEGNPYFRTHESVRLGIGGYAGLRVKSKQVLRYNENDQCVKVKQKGDFNVSNLNYGLSAYVGYRATSLYVKYDLNPLFKDNPVEQNNISLGVRFDFN